VNPLCREYRLDDRRDGTVLAREQRGRHVDNGGLGAEAGEALRELAANRSAAEHQQAARQLTQGPDGV